MTKTVETFDGTVAERSDCRRISDQFYIKNKQCFFMSDNKWHRINNGLIALDHETGKYVFKSDFNLVKGVVGFSDLGDPIYGLFSVNKIKNSHIYLRNGAATTLNEDIIPKELYTEIISRGEFIKNTEIGETISKRDVSRKQIGKRYDDISLHYTFEHNYEEFKMCYDRFFEFSKIPDQSKGFYRELNNTTFGLEFESYNGIIPQRFCYKNGLIPLRDGSLRHNGVEPYEYTTIPLEGEKGLLTIDNICSLLNKYCEININGSLHIHIGSIPISKEYVVSMYRTLCSIQDEMYSMFPKYMSETATFKPNGKNYCNPLDEIKFTTDVNKNLEKLFIYYITGDNGNGNLEVEEPEFFIDEDGEEQEIRRDPGRRRRRKTWTIDGIMEDYGIDRPYIGMSHPEDTSRFLDHKWNIQMRYRHTNLINLMFGQRGTVEFRLHTATFNKDKAINWLFIANAICRFAYNNRMGISKNGNKSSLKQIIGDVYSGQLSRMLSSYIDYRVDFMDDSFKNHRDGSGILDVKNDNLKKWKHPLKSLI